MTANEPATTRWGIIGTGASAARFVADLALLPDARAQAIGSRSASAAAGFGERFAVPHRHGSYPELVADPEVDAVYVATRSTPSTRCWRSRPANRCWWRSRSR